MEKNRIVLMAGLGCVVLGGLILGTSLVLGGTPGFYIDENGIHSTEQAKARSASPHILEKTKLDGFENLELYVDYANVNIIEADDYYLEYQISGSTPEPSYEVKNNSFTFSEGSRNNRVIFFGSGFNFSRNSDDSYESHYINLYLPKDAKLGSVNIYNDCGNIEIDRLKSQTAKISSDYGNITISSLNASTALLKCDSGDMELGDIKSDSLELKNSYGNIKSSSLTGNHGEFSLDAGRFYAASLDFEELQANNEYGDIVIENGTLNNSNFNLDSGNLTGKLDGIQQLSVKNEYGSVSLQLPEKLEQYQCSLTTEYGHISLPDSTMLEASDTTVYKAPGKTANAISIYCESGDISIVD